MPLYIASFIAETISHLLASGWVEDHNTPYENLGHMNHKRACYPKKEKEQFCLTLWNRNISDHDFIKPRKLQWPYKGDFIYCNSKSFLNLY